MFNIYENHNDNKTHVYSPGLAENANPRMLGSSVSGSLGAGRQMRSDMSSDSVASCRGKRLKMSLFLTSVSLRPTAPTLKIYMYTKIKCNAGCRR